MRLKRMLGLAAIAVTAGLLLATAPAHATVKPGTDYAPAAGLTHGGPAYNSAPVTPDSASGWYQMYMVAQTNQLCTEGPGGYLAPVITITCNPDDTYWECRVLNVGGSGWAFDVPGDDYECVEPDKAFMFGYSGGAFKMENDDASQYIADQASAAGFGGVNWEKMEYIGTSASKYFGSGPEYDPLGVEGSEGAGHYWRLCSSSQLASCV